MIETLKEKIIEILESCNDPDLLDLILKLLISES